MWHGPDDGRDTLRGDVGDGCRWLAGMLDGAPRRNQLAPGHGPGTGSRCTHREHCRCTRGGCMCIASCARAPDLSGLAFGTRMCVRTVAEYVEESSTCAFVYVGRRARRAHLS